MIPLSSYGEEEVKKRITGDELAENARTIHGLRYRQEVVDAYLDAWLGVMEDHSKKRNVRIAVASLPVLRNGATADDMVQVYEELRRLKVIPVDWQLQETPPGAEPTYFQWGPVEV